MTDKNNLVLQHWMNAWVETNSLPGMIVGVYDENNKELFSHISNKSNQDPSLNYSRESLFRMYSMTKPVISVGILLLIEKGLLSLDDEVSKYIPSFKNVQVLSANQPEDGTILTEPLKTPLKIIHLLTHTSGISYGIFGNTLVDGLTLKGLGPDVINLNLNTPLNEFCNLIANIPLAFQPGTQFQYGFSTDVLGFIIEIISGKKLDEFLTEEIFLPLGMKDSYFRVPENQIHRLVELYEVSPGVGYTVSPSLEKDRSEKRILLSGGAGLVSTLADYSKFTNFLLNKGKILHSTTRLLQEQTIDLMTSNHLFHTFHHPTGDILHMAYDKGFVALLSCMGFGFGLGVSIVETPETTKAGPLVSNVGQYGWTGLAGTIFYNDPQTKTSVILITQLLKSNETYPIKEQLKYHVAQLLKK